MSVATKRRSATTAKAKVRKPTRASPAANGAALARGGTAITAARFKALGKFATFNQYNPMSLPSVAATMQVLSEDPASLPEIAEAIGLEATRLAPELKGLARAGWVEYDGPSRRYALTKAGARLWEVIEARLGVT